MKVNRVIETETNDIHVDSDILGERYGYPDDAPQDDEDNTEEDWP